MAKLADKCVFANGIIAGLSYREWLAAMCLQGILNESSVINFTDDERGVEARRARLELNAKVAVAQADALIKALEASKS